MKRRLYRYFFRGLITFLPVFLTLYVLVVFVTWTESVAMKLVHPLTGDFYLPGLGIGLGALLIIGLGALVSRPETARWLSMLELPFNNLPVVKSIYSSLKNFADYFAPHAQSPQQVVLLRMPGNEMGIVGLITRQSMAGLPAELSALEDQVAVYLPMGYMIGGYTVFVPRAWVTPVNMSVEEAMRMALIAFMSSNRNGAGSSPGGGSAAQ